MADTDRFRVLTVNDSQYQLEPWLAANIPPGWVIVHWRQGTNLWNHEIVIRNGSHG